jgi:undecaprenyl diphosphate synthase
MQSTLPTVKLHVAIIMDGNGRWATRRGLPRIAGHRAGVRAVRRVVEAAPDLDIGILTLFAFSSDNWRRPADEVGALMRLLERHLQSDAQRFIDGGARLSVIGRRDRLPERLRRAIDRVESASSRNARLHLRIALDYSSRHSIASAAALLERTQPPSIDAFSGMLSKSLGERAGAPEVDLLIRSGGEKRLSDFLLWESAYAELLFMDQMWPDFGGDHLRAAVEEFHRRERRFGALDESVPPVHSLRIGE